MFPSCRGPSVFGTEPCWHITCCWSTPAVFWSPSPFPPPLAASTPPRLPSPLYLNPTRFPGNERAVGLRLCLCSLGFLFLLRASAEQRWLGWCSPPPAPVSTPQHGATCQATWDAPSLAVQSTDFCWRDCLSQTLWPKHVAGQFMRSTHNEVVSCLVW